MGKYSEREILIWLDSIHISQSSIERLLNYFQDLSDILDVQYDDLLNIPGLNKDHIQKIISGRKFDNIDKTLYRLAEKDIKYITCIDEEYPQSLKNIFARPLVIYYKGEFQNSDQVAIGIVGSRKSTAYGKWACEKFTRELVNLGVTIVSGLALGIDTIAHKTALENGGRTIAVLGNGLDIKYPKNNEKLYDEITQNGLVLSEFPIGTQPFAYNFPQRNRIISGLSKAIIVVEAKEKSGSLITAHHALEQGKDVFAVPGNINSIYSGGTNRLIKDGAFPLVDLEDLLDEVKELKDKSVLKKVEGIDYSGLSDTEISIVNLLKDGPIHGDMIAHKTNLDISELMSILTILELKGIIKELTSRIYSI